MVLFDYLDGVSLEGDDLCFSRHSDGDLFDFMDTDEEGLFDSRGSTHTDFQFEVLEIEAHGAIQEETEDADFPRSEVEAEAVDTGAVDFDPPPQLPRQHWQQQRQINEQHRQSSGGDASVSSAPVSSPRGAQDPQAVCRDQLQKLADSMRRSWTTRCHVAMQRDLLPPEQRRALEAAKEHLSQQAMQHVQRQQEQEERLQDQKRRQEEEHLSVRMASFFKNGLYTRGLEQSRRRIGLYMGQVNHGTL